MLAEEVLEKLELLLGCLLDTSRLLISLPEEKFRLEQDYRLYHLCRKEEIQ